MSIVPHKYHDFIGATPDGFVIIKNKNGIFEEKLLEIKCPTKRIINPIGKNIFEICPYNYLA